MLNQRQTVLNYLREHGSITTREAVVELGIMSLPRRVMELRRAGENISLEYKTSPEGARYGVYRLGGGNVDKVQA